MAKSDTYKTKQLGNGYYITYDEVSNGLGGFRPANIMLHNDEKDFCRVITDYWGNFMDYPGHTEGGWQDELVGDFYAATQFVVNISKFVDGICRFSWMVQPDGMYWMDEDGYGMTNDEEIWLYALMNEKGEFITPFFDKNDSRYSV